MNGKILLFGFESLMSILSLDAAVKPLGIELVPVARADYNRTLAVLAGLETDSGPSVPYNGIGLGGQMMVLCNLQDKLETVLPVLNSAGVGPQCLKAVLTPSNRSWTPMVLYGELAREHNAMQGR